MKNPAYERFLTDRPPMSEDRSCPILTLTSGRIVRMRQVKLYDETMVQEITKLRAQVLKNLGGVSTGIGFLGSPEWGLGRCSCRWSF